MTDADISPDLVRLNAAISFAEKRIVRAAEKRRLADNEMTDALGGLDAARARRNAWLEANPQPQIEMFA